MTERRGTWDLAIGLGLVLLVGEAVVLAWGLTFRLLDGPWGLVLHGGLLVAVGLLARMHPRRTALELAALVVAVTLGIWAFGDGSTSWPLGPWRLLADAGLVLAFLLPAALLGADTRVGWLRPERARRPEAARLQRELSLGLVLGLGANAVLVALLFAFGAGRQGDVLATTLPATGSAATLVGGLAVLLPELTRWSALGVLLAQPALLGLWALASQGEPFPWGSLLLLDLVWAGCLVVPALAWERLGRVRGA